ncbi:MAG: serine/threonine-protein phosphatase, partial [Desulfobacteraceae bacterium]|nr:serine/threonine-protein phosphatase [Desulfobacteraceae bacterium]
FVIADVSGKGVTAAMFMGVSRTLLRFTALQGLSADKVLSHVNDLLCVDNEICMFVTVIYGVLNIKTGELSYANGGHNPPVRKKAGSPIEILPRTKGIALGIMDDSDFEQGQARLEPGDLLYLYTDGMPDAENEAHVFFSEDRLMDELGKMEENTPEFVVNRTYKIVTDHVAAGPQFDDMTQLAIQFQPKE